jgi:hypothetical protein
MLIDHRDDGNPRTYVPHVGWPLTDTSQPIDLHHSTA